MTLLSVWFYALVIALTGLIIVYFNGDWRFGWGVIAGAINVAICLTADRKL